MKTNVAYIFLFFSAVCCLYACSRSSKSDYTESGERYKDLKLSVLKVNIEDVFEEDMKDVRGKMQHVVRKVNVDCELKYDLQQAEMVNDTTLRLPPCQIHVAVNMDNTVYIYGGNNRYPESAEIDFRKKVNREVRARLYKNGYEERAFEYARKLLNVFLGEKMHIIPSEDVTF